MNTNIELEYKVLLNESQFHTLCSLYPSLAFKKQTNTYYDTEDGMIRSMRGALRIREVDDIFMFTLKIHQGNDLIEYECLVKENSPAVFQCVEITTLLKQYGIALPLHETTSLTTYRAMVVSEYAELCFDENHYHGLVDYEIEYEYKKEHDGLRAFQEILKPISLVYTTNCKSKIQRALDSIV